MKPSWSDAPEWANWLAKDRGGEWYWYENEPNRFVPVFGEKGEIVDLVDDVMYWASLEQRPKEGV